MISVSESWKEAHNKRLLPETFIEISCGFSDVGIADVVDAAGVNEAFFSNTANVIGTMNATPTTTNYATLEHNLWLLDGSKTIIPDEGPYSTPGYVSEDDSEASVVLNLPEPRNVAIPGFTITWSKEYEEYPTSFKVEAKNKDIVIASTTVTGNSSVRTEVDLELIGYDCVVVTPLDWVVPGHRSRVDLIAFGHVVTFHKGDVLSYTHEQHGSLNSAELPKNSINFTLDNTDGRWNPSNPSGDGKYLSERQEVNVRYGLLVNNTVEWVNAGRFYLSEWRAPANGLEAHFVARDIFEYMLNTPYTGITSGTLLELVSSAISVASLPEDFSVYLDQSLQNYTATIKDNYTVAEVIQMCANAAACAMWQDRAGVLNISPLNFKHTGYCISNAFSYTHPEVELSKPLRAVSVAYGDGARCVHPVGNSGETQTVENPLVSSEEQASKIADWVRGTLETRKTVSGEFRADPRLDLFDVVRVESKYGGITPVAITNVKYEYTGSYRAKYTGRVLVGGSDLFVLGISALGEEVLGQ